MARAANADGEVHGLVFDRSLIPDLYPQGIEENDGVDPFQGPVLPLRDFVQDRVGDGRDELG